MSSSGWSQVGTVALVATGLSVLAAACTDEPSSSPTLPPILTTTTLPAPTTANPIAQNQFYTIQQGDNLSSIAERYGVTVEAIMQKNNIPDPNSISVGQVLELPDEAVIPTTSTVTPPEPTVVGTFGSSP